MRKEIVAVQTKCSLASWALLFHTLNLVSFQLHIQRVWHSELLGHRELLWHMEPFGV